MSKNTLEFTDQNFSAEVLNSDTPVLVDFWAEWCGPCKMLTPTIDELASEYDSKAKIGKLNVDNHPNVATKYGIRSIPCLLFFKNGEVQKQIMGTVPKSDIAAALDELF